MKTKHIIIYMVLAVMSVASCIQPKPEHQIESVSEFMDSLKERGRQVYHHIYCFGDSVYQDQYWYIEYLYDSCKNENQNIQLFLSDKTPDLLDRLCRKSENSYRYSSNDSLDYSITMSNKPKELVTFKHYRYESRCDVYNLVQTTMRPSQSSSKPFDPTPIRVLLQKFLSEQKKVEKHDVCYEWDEGVPFDDNIIIHKHVSHNVPDSLAATRTTGTVYIIPVEGKGRCESVIADFSNRMVKMITEQPIEGVRFWAVYTGEEKKYYQMQHLSIQNTRYMFQIMLQLVGDSIYIFEVTSEGAPRWAYPVNWWAEKHIHNNEVADSSRTENNTPSGATKMDSLFLGL